MQSEPREEISPDNPAFAHRLSAMIDARLTTFRHYARWTDSVIERLDSPPAWVIELSVTKYIREAAQIVRRHAVDHGATSIANWDADVDEYVAATYLRYDRREISWATCLEECGRKADSSGGKNECEYFYYMLNEFEESDFSQDVESRQRDAFLQEYGDLVASVRRTYHRLLAFKTSGKQSPH